jgi:PAB-dependent poly(A)-specific ribonuclease subunit 3
LESKFGFDPRVYPSQAQAASEEFLWNFIIQIIGCLNAIHTAHLASKMVHPSKILVTSKNRVRLAGFGLADILGMYDSTSAGSLRHAQFEDVLCVGKVIMVFTVFALDFYLSLPQQLQI